MEAIYLHDWSDGGWSGETGIEAIKHDFEIGDDALDGVDILLASYSYENYSGDAFVLYRKDGKYYEVNGSHCSCYGLEGQWEPEEANLDELYHRVTEGHFGRDEWTGNEFANELKTLLEALKEDE